MQDRLTVPQRLLSVTRSAGIRRTFGNSWSSATRRVARLPLTRRRRGGPDADRVRVTATMGRWFDQGGHPWLSTLLVSLRRTCVSVSARAGAFGRLLEGLLLAGSSRLRDAATHPDRAPRPPKTSSTRISIEPVQRQAPTRYGRPMSSCSANWIASSIPISRPSLQAAWNDSPPIAVRSASTCRCQRISLRGGLISDNRSREAAAAAAICTARPFRATREARTAQSSRQPSSSDAHLEGAKRAQRLNQFGACRFDVAIAQVDLGQPPQRVGLASLVGGPSADRERAHEAVARPTWYAGVEFQLADDQFAFGLDLAMFQLARQR